MHRIKGGENFKSGLKTRAWEKEWSSTVWRRLAGAWREADDGGERRRVGGTGAAQEQRARGVWASAGGGAVKSSGAEAEGRHRSGGGGAAYGRGYKGGGFSRRKKNSVKLTRGARGRVK